MKKLLLLLSPFFFSCVPNKIVSHAFKLTDTTETAYFEPLAFVSLVEKGNAGRFNDSLSLVSRLTLDSIIQNNENLRIKHKISIGDPSVENTINNELANTFQTIISTNKIKGVPIPPGVESAIRASNQRFALATVVSGFGRRKGNYGGQVAKGVGVGILTLGMYTPVPVKSSSALYTILIDAQQNKIIYYSKTTPVEKSPTERKVLEKQYRRLFEGYLYDQ